MLSPNRRDQQTTQAGSPSHTTMSPLKRSAAEDSVTIIQNNEFSTTLDRLSLKPSSAMHQQKLNSATQLDSLSMSQLQSVYMDERDSKSIFQRHGVPQLATMHKAAMSQQQQRSSSIAAKSSGNSRIRSNHEYVPFINERNHLGSLLHRKVA